ncbi:flavodoxin [Mobilitalea sibirica]|uniref:Flavodoxin n=2 Tax=Mobilitalea sibirica TaxID=1462919 RepID=A0A8J7H5R6_9FIRM|nr:flavodoxin [Mobilitalea sibirica]MBH1941804.1 flavodoxin [Mobilitalea sibirica]
MKKVVVIYWSGTGNTKAMAEAVAEGCTDMEVRLLQVSEASVDHVAEADAVAFGCPAMGSEELDDTEMEPFIASLSDNVVNKPIVLFGSYGWGNGEWMADWEDRMLDLGAKLITEGLIINEMPDEEGIKKCKELGKTLAKAIE